MWCFFVPRPILIERHTTNARTGKDASRDIALQISSAAGRLLGPDPCGTRHKSCLSCQYLNLFECRKEILMGMTQSG